MDDIVERIIKLHAKAESAKEIGSLEEAAAFAAKVSDLLIKHKLDMSVLSGGKEEEVTHMEMDWQGYPLLNKRSTWREALINTVAIHHFCRIIVSKGSSRILLVGKESDRKVVEYMSVALIRKAEELADIGAEAVRGINFRRYGRKTDGGWRKSFLMGFVQGVYNRLKEAKASSEASNSSTALIIRKGMEEVDSYMKNLKTRKLPVQTATIKNAEGYQKGFEAGNSANVGPAINSNGATVKRLNA